MSASGLACSCGFPPEPDAWRSSPHRPSPEYNRAAQQCNEVDDSKRVKQRPINRVIKNSRAGPCKTSAGNGAAFSANNYPSYAYAGV